jgi:peptide/nickel transport system substrate-binding protein
MTGLAVGLAGCSSAASNTEGQPTYSAASQAHPFVMVNSWNYLDGLNPLEGSSVTTWTNSLLFDPPLAIVSRTAPNYDKMLPAVASHWTFDPKTKTLTIDINPAYHWSNGKPVTAADVVFSLQFGLYLDQWIGRSAGVIRAVNSHEVQVTEGPLPDPYFVPQVLGNTPIYPASEFARFMPKNVYHLFVVSDSTVGAAATAASTALTNAFNRMQSAFPKLSLSCGPWVIDSVTNSEALLKPNPYFPGHQHYPWVELLNGSNPNQIYAWAAESAFTYGAIPQPTRPLVHEWLAASPYHKVILFPSQGNVGIGFNTSIYPYNLRPVRQAFAYLINRTEVAKIANPLTATPIKYPIGYFDYWTTNRWLTKSELAKLNPYPYDPEKGVKLLESVGFRRAGRGWLMPNGQPFVVNIYAQAGAPDQDGAAEAVKANLNAVGIAANVFFPPVNVFTSKFYLTGKNGGYPVYFNYLAFSVHSYNSMGEALYYGGGGQTLNYTTKVCTTPAGDYGQPANQVLPNGQPINPCALATGLKGIYWAKGAVKQHTIWLLSEAANYNLTMLPLWGYDKSLVYVDTEYYTGFPGPNNPFWQVFNVIGPDWVVWMNQGLIHPTPRL